MLSDALHHRYFRAKDGHWRGKIRFRVTDPRGLRASSIPFADKWSLRCLSLASRLSALTLRTSVECRGNDVLHTTRVTNLGIPVVFPKKNGVEVKGVSGCAFARTRPGTRAPGWSAGGRGCRRPRRTR